MSRAPINVFATTRYVLRGGRVENHRFAVELVARGSGTVMYRSKTCDTLVEAQTLAFKYLARTPGLQFDPKVSP